MFGLFVRFTCKDEASAEAYDRLVAETIEAIKTDEPGTLAYARPPAAGEPVQRGGVFAAAQGGAAGRCEGVSSGVAGAGALPRAQGPARPRRRYLAKRGQYLTSTEVDRLTLQTGKGTGG